MPSEAQVLEMVRLHPELPWVVAYSDGMTATRINGWGVYDGRGQLVCECGSEDEAVDVLVAAFDFDLDRG